ncbi:MAG: cytochrome c3 family protein [Proteobacteria bacterium]|nr:cytochrome c3 family protein [Pseudomonadota bacterium]
MKKISLIIIVIVFFYCKYAFCVGPLLGSKHDLSSPSVGRSEVCVFCHTPHYAGNFPLWNKRLLTSDPTAVFVAYSSPTMDTTPSNPPNLVSLLCLSCHYFQNPGLTGSVAHGLLNAPGSGNPSYPPNCIKCHFGGGPAYHDALKIGPNLKDDHPVSMKYPQPSEDPDFNLPPDSIRGWSDVRLFSGYVECSSCHDPHNPTYKPFLVRSNASSQLCLVCHKK